MLIWAMTVTATMSTTPTFTLGKSITLVVNLVTLIGPFLADWKYDSPTRHKINLRTSKLKHHSETHIYNPNWPPHARYHNGSVYTSPSRIHRTHPNSQTMSMGAFIGFITFYIILILIPSTTSFKEQKLHLTWVLVLQNMIYLSSLSGILYPGAGWMDPQFGDGKPQLYGFPVLLVLLWCGWWVECRRLGGIAGVKRT
jgi:hypothetical protein